MKIFLTTLSNSLGRWQVANLPPFRWLPIRGMFAVGRITDERFDTLLVEYEVEQKELQASVKADEKRLSVFEEDTARVEQFMEHARKYTDFSELTTPMIL